MYNHAKIEKDTQKFWKKKKVYKTTNEKLKLPYYVLDMFPYPSGAGLHVGHPKGYTANDIIARYKHAQGYNVLHPMGWDAFGLPAENYAIKTGTHPKVTTEKNIETFKNQIQAIGFSYDWGREINTTDPSYYKWTQWIFLKMFEQGLAYEQDLPINYCPSCKTGLANEEVLANFTCERCGTVVEKKQIRQWVLAITKYAERLLQDVDKLDWPESIKQMQRNWIGKSIGTEFEMKKSDDETKKISVYTTRIDTVFGVTYAVIAPDHKDVNDFITDEQRVEAQQYIDNALRQSDQDRTAENKDKTGVFTGSYVINPFNNTEVPLWIGDYVLGNYGTGAVMAVPAHDERDFEFAKKYDLPINRVVAEYNILTGKCKPKEGIQTRQKKCSTIIIEHPNKELYLVQDFENNNKCFTGGGIEDGETPKECAIREMQEESGLHNIKSIKQIGIMVGHGYKDRKGINCKDPDYIFHAKLENLDGFKEDAFENIAYKNIWLTKDEIINDDEFKSHHKKQFLDFLKGDHAYTDKGILLDSGDFTGQTSTQAQINLTKFADEKGFGKKKINYKLRDWLFSRQRYWGEPIPLIHLDHSQLKEIEHISDLSEATDENKAYILKRYPKPGESSDGCSCGEGSERKIRELVIGKKVYSKIYDGINGKIVCDYDLPLELPETDNFEPAGNGNSPLAAMPEFVEVELAENLTGRRETNTMPQWGGSCWYYLRFMDPNNENALVDPDIEKYWGQVDSYIGGAEHAVLHLLYARFWHKFLYDIGVVSHDEPFYRLRNVGLIQAYAFQNDNGALIPNDLVEEKDDKFYNSETGEQLERIIAKMSKSLKNVVNPNDIIEMHGADALRMYEMYLSDFKDSAPWDLEKIVGITRFLDKAYAVLVENKLRPSKDDKKSMKVLHKAIDKITSDIEEYKFNTAIAQLMIVMNEGHPSDPNLFLDWKRDFIKLLHPFAPHLAEAAYSEYRMEIKPIKKVVYATTNHSKVSRLKKILDDNLPNLQIVTDEKIEIGRENSKCGIGCAIDKIDKLDLNTPVLSMDTTAHFDDPDIDPTKVKRNALESAGKKEEDLTQEQIAEIMVDHYAKVANNNGGQVDFYYTDNFALKQDGRINIANYRRHYTLENEEKGPRDIYMPMRSMYKSKITGKYAVDTDDESFAKEFHLSGEVISQLLGYLPESIYDTFWPVADPRYLVDDTITIAVQVMGKVRGQIEIEAGEEKESVLQKAKENENVLRWIENKNIVKEIYVPGKIVNLVIK